MESISQVDAYASLVGRPQSIDHGPLLLIGEHGIGKSHLLTSAHSASMTRTVLVRAQPTERRLPLAGITSLFAALRQNPNSEPPPLLLAPI